MTGISLPNTSEFAPIDMSPYILGRGEAAWMLTNPNTLTAELETVRKHVEEANTNAGGVAVLPFESSIEAILA